jgi:hypothetical protein
VEKNAGEMMIRLFQLPIRPSTGSFRYLLFSIAFCTWHALQAQTPDSSSVEEDYSQYDNATFTDASARRYCSPKIFDLSPQRFISLAWDAQMPYNTTFSLPGRYAPDLSAANEGERARAVYTGGLRVGANIPVVSRNSIVWQMGANFWDVGYRFNDLVEQPGADGLTRLLEDKGLRTLGLNSTVFKPLNETAFLLFQGSADLNGNFTWADFQSLRYLRYSAAAIWGRRPHDRKQWGVGLSRTYRVGEMNYIPVFLFNYTSPNRRWGTEILFPARAHVRRTFNPRNLLLVGYELEGQSYRISELSSPTQSVELRRGELRTRMEYQRQLSGFVWLSFQAGWRYDWSYNVDVLDRNGREFFRGFTGNQPYRMINELGNALYFNIGVHLVSP